MAEPLAVVPALNTMIPLCLLLAFGASVSQYSWVVKVVSRTVLLALTTLSWLSQPVSKIQNLVSQLWGHDTRDQPLLFLATFQDKAAWYQDRQLVCLCCNSLAATLLFIGLIFSWLCSPTKPISNNKITNSSNMSPLPLSTSFKNHKVEEIINECLAEFSLEEIYVQQLNNQDKFRRLFRVLPSAHRRIALDLLLQKTAPKTDFSLFVKESRQNNLVPPVKSDFFKSYEDLKDI